MSWRVRASRITHDGRGTLAVVIFYRHRAGHGFRLGSALPGGAVEHEIPCPVCATDRGPTLTGAWGEAARLTCPEGHTWTPRLPGLGPEDLLREIVRHALGPGHLTYAEARTDPDERPPTPYRDAVERTLADAARDLNRHHWVFDAYEAHVAADLLRRLAWPATITGADQVTEAARLGWLHDGLTALREYAGMTGGRLGGLLAAVDAVLGPALDVRLADLEPGPGPDAPPALADPERALGDLGAVLRAGSTGDVAY